MDEVLAAVIQLWSVLRPIRNTMQKKGLKFALIMELLQLKFTYFTVVKILNLGHH
jgi:hypothetical protein